MKNTFKLFGIIAFAMIIVLSLTGCPDGNNLIRANLTGSASLDNNAPKVGDTITATYAPGNGSGAQTWQWFRVGIGTEDIIQNATANTYTSTAADVGKKIKVQLSFDDQNGSVSATTTSAVAPTAITYTIAQADGADTTADTTAINFTFSASVTGLTADDITITGGTGAVTKGALSGSDTSWTLGVTVTAAGNVTVHIAKSGIEVGTKDITVYKAGQTAPNDITYTVTQTGGTDGTADTTGIAFTFSASVAGLTANDITITDGTGAVTKGTLSGSGTSWTLGVTVTAAGNLTIQITKSGIEAGTKNVTVYKAGQSAPTLTGITLNTASVKRDYNLNETLNLTGFVVTANYSDSTSAAVAAYTANPTHGAALTTAGTITVTISYTEGAVTQSDTFTVTVTDPNQPTEGLAYELITYGTNAYTYRVRKGTVTSGSVVIPATHEGLPVREIGSQAFGGLIGLTAVRIPDSVTVIGDYAFSSCTGLTGITLPEGVTSIGSYAFQNCTGLTGITIPENVTTIDSGAFTGCTSLTDITIDNTVFVVSQSRNWLSIFPATGLSVTFKRSVSSYAFYSNSPNSAFAARLTSVTIAEGVEYIFSYAFYNCSGLTSVTIPDSVKQIYSYAFYFCTGLTSINIPDNVTAIGDEAFYFCTGLTSITIPDSVTFIGSHAFYNCNSLTSITIGTGVTSVGSNNPFDWCTSLTSVTVNCASIGNSWFSGTPLTSVTIGANVTSIGSDAFSLCSDLTEIIIPDSVTSIGSYAFQNCTGLTGITIGAGVTSIGSNTFQYCTSLTSVTFRGTILNDNFHVYAFSAQGLGGGYIGDLRDKFYATNSANGVPGRYTRPNTTSLTWTRVS